MLKSLSYKKQQCIINIGIFIIYIFWSFLLPFNQGPDEYMRNEVIKGIIQLKRVVMVGDVDVYYGPWGFNYSYLLSNLPYILAAILNNFFDKVLNIPIYWYGRIISLLCGYYANILFYKLLKLTLDKKENNIELLIFAFWPQITFMYIYANADSISIMLSVSLLYYTMLGLKSNWSKDILIKLSIIVGFSILSYYYLYTVVLGMFIVFIVDFTQKKLSIKKLILPTLIVGVIIFPFILRNYILYKDIFGLSIVKVIAEQLAREDLKPSLRTTYYFQGNSLFDLILNKNWILSTLKSYIGGVGNMEHFLPKTFYFLYTTILVISLVKLKKMFQILKTKRLIVYFVGILLSIIINVILFIHYNYYSDYQPQGRYLISSAPGLILIIVMLLEQFKNKFLLNFLAYLNIISIFYFINVYMNISINKKLSLKILIILLGIIFIVENFRRLNKMNYIYTLILLPLLIFGYFFNFKNLSLGIPQDNFVIENKNIEYVLTYQKNIGEFIHIKILSNLSNKKVLVLENNVYNSISEFNIIKNNTIEQQFLIPLREIKKDSKAIVGQNNNNILEIDSLKKIDLKKENIDLEINSLNNQSDYLKENIQNFELKTGEINLDSVIKTKDFIIFKGWGILKGIQSDKTETFLEVRSKEEIEKFILSQKKERKDVTIHFKDGNNYDESGFFLRIDKKFLEEKNVSIIIINSEKKIFYKKELKIERESK